MKKLVFIVMLTSILLLSIVASVSADPVTYPLTGYTTCPDAQVLAIPENPNYDPVIVQAYRSRYAIELVGEEWYTLYVDGKSVARVLIEDFFEYPEYLGSEPCVPLKHYVPVLFTDPILVRYVPAPPPIPIRGGSGIIPLMI